MDEHSAAGRASRHAGLRSYRLVEVDREGRQQSEVFSAPDDDAALERALGVGRGRIVELWCGPHLIRRWTDARQPGPEAKLQ